ncbi:4Fe-4S single cluster domain-containing protein [Streptomyces phaeochromogenes]|uniref:4Fe-4S single cluster domain-containing protein n=1 Tax=Streptomyces phaeochromogenes TaxID=1923 RepID=UPI003686BE7E
MTDPTPDPDSVARHLQATRDDEAHDKDEGDARGPADTSRPGELTLNRVLDRCATLGPNLRAVIWVQGCPLRCRGCVAPETLPFTGGEVHTVAEVADWLTSLTDVEGVTLSGGEPFSQAQPLADLLDAVRERRPDFSAMAYSGFRHEALRRGTPGQRALLDRLDLLVDGPYVAARHGDLLWRGSSNQRVVVLTERYPHVTSLTDTGAGIEVSVGDDGQFSWAGVPAIPGFRTFVEEQLAAAGYVVDAREAAAATHTQREIRGTDERITEVQHRDDQCGPTAAGSPAPGPAGG